MMWITKGQNPSMPTGVSLVSSLKRAQRVGAGRLPHKGPASDYGLHRAVWGRPLGIVGVLIAHQTVVDRLAQQRRQMMLEVSTPSGILETATGRNRQTQCILQRAEETWMGTADRGLEKEARETGLSCPGSSRKFWVYSTNAQAHLPLCSAAKQ